MSIFYPLELLASWLVFNVFSIPSQSHLANALTFFIYDSLKIIILLFVITFFVSIIRSFLPPEKIRQFLSKKNKYLGHIVASLFGIITPFCSCSAISLFLGFVEVGVPLGITFSFLVSAPMINEVALVLLFSMFGFKIASIYVLSGLLIAIFAGIVIGYLKLENLVEKFGKNNQHQALVIEKLTWRQRIIYARNYATDIIRSVWLYILVGIGIGAWIHGYVPADFMAQYAGADKWYAVPLAVLIGIPLYSNAAGIIPLVGVLTEKGVAMGTTLAFMMAVTALSLPEFIILRRVMKTKLIVIFASIVGIGIIFTGYLFNFLIK